MKGSKGVTLLELVLAIAILTIAILPMLGLLDAEVFGSARVRAMRAAIDLAREEVEFVQDPEIKEKDVLSQERPAKIGERRFRVVREVEPASDPLRIGIKIFEEKGTTPLFQMTFLKEDIGE